MRSKVVVRTANTTESYFRDSIDQLQNMDFDGKETAREQLNERIAILENRLEELNEATAETNEEAAAKLENQIYKLRQLASEIGDTSEAKWEDFKKQATAKYEKIVESL